MSVVPVGIAKRFLYFGKCVAETIKTLQTSIHIKLILNHDFPRSLVVTKLWLSSSLVYFSPHRMTLCVCGAQGLRYVRPEFYLLPIVEITHLKLFILKCVQFDLPTLSFPEVASHTMQLRLARNTYVAQDGLCLFQCCGLKACSTTPKGSFLSF